MRTHFKSRVLAAVAGATVIVAGSVGVSAQTVEQFYKGKQISLIVGAGAGGAYDLVSRTVARHMGRHIPGQPGFVVSNMVGASSLIMTNYLYNAAKKDGTVMGMGNANIALEPGLNMLSRRGGKAQFDVGKIKWIGSPLQQPQVVWLFHTAPAKTFADLKTTKIILGSLGVGGDNFVVPWLMNQLLGTRFEMVTGYKAQGDVFVAAERGEVHGNVAILPNLIAAKSDWWREKKVRVLATAGAKRSPSQPDVPTAAELASNAADRAVFEFWSRKYHMAYPLFVGPDVPTDRVAALRAAFDATMKDGEFLDDAKRLKLEIEPYRGEEIEKLMVEIQATPQDLVARVAQLIKPPSSGKK
jgi:tripartite-type tricarboxylate transporter receptor subunit TctC